MKVSVVIPVYNNERFLKECLDSTIAQTLDDYEIIVINDCSTDRSASIIEEYAKKDSRIRLHHHEQNRGVSAARNTGIEMSTGDYLIFLDGDDYWLDKRLLETAYDIATLNNSDIVQFDFCRNTDEYERKPLNTGSAKTISITGSANWNIRYSVWALLISRGLIEQHDISFNEDLIMGEDALFCCSLYCNAKILSIMDNTLYFYRINPEGTNNSTWDKEHLFCTVRWFRKAIDAITKSNAYAYRPDILQQLAGERLMALADRLAPMAVKALDMELFNNYIKQWSECFEFIDQDYFNKHFFVDASRDNCRLMLKQVLDNDISGLSETIRTTITSAIPEGSEITLSRKDARKLGEQILSSTGQVVRCDFGNGTIVYLSLSKAHQLARQLIYNNNPLIKLKMNK